MAGAVAQRLASAHPGEFDVDIVDPFASEAPRATTRLATALYGPLTVYAPWIWGGMWHASNSRPMAGLVEIGLRVVDPRVKRRIAELQPAAIVSFHALLGRAAVRARRALGMDVPVLTLVTDLVDVHALWATQQADLVIVPSRIAFDRCRRNGVPPERIALIGLPVDPLFTEPRLDPERRRARRRELGLDPDRFTVMLSGGADGSGELVRRARLIAGHAREVGLVVVCGHNQRAERQLEGLVDHAGRPVTVLGFIHDMPRWMSAVDAVVTKAGAGTVVEALCSGLPLLIDWFLPGQERGNMEWVVAGGAGRYVPDDGELLRELAELSAPGSPSLAAMRTAAAQMARPHATAEIAEAVRAMARRER